MEPTRLEIALPSVSVIIAAYNEQAFIETTLASIFDSGFPCEVIVVDDGSSDRTPESFRDLLPTPRSSPTLATRVREPP